MKDLSYLRNCSLFLNWSDENIESLHRICEIRNLSPGEILFNQGETSDAFYLIRRGTIAIKKYSGDGEESIASFGSNANFGELAMLTRGAQIENRSATAQAIEASEIVEIKFNPFQKFLESSPEASASFYQNLAIDLATRIRKTSEDLAGIRALRLRHA